MSYSSPVFTMPDASTEKLPFVHSDFKPRATFAKSFGGCRRQSKLSSSMREMRVTRLPQIMYNGADQRTLITFGSVKRGVRREYPGFQGHSKISKRKTENEKQSHGKYIKSKRMPPKDGFLPELTPKSIESKSFSDQKDTEDRAEDSDLYNQVHNSLESLIFVDEDPAVRSRSPSFSKLHSRTHTNNEYKDSQGILKPSPSSPTSHPGSQQEPMRGRKNSSDDRRHRQVNFQTPEDSLTKELDKKINQARGKSGMKRGRRREPDHTRILGDVMTSKRLTELLSPRKPDTVLTFS